MNGRFRVTKVIGRGAFATVLAAERPDGSLVALKVLLTEQNANIGAVSRFRDEATMLSRLDHPNIVAVYGLHDYSGRPVLELEYVEGAPLHKLLRQSPDGLPPSVALQAALDVSKALRYAQEACGPDGEPLRIVHRDVNPSNLILTRPGLTRILDFGIAKGEFAGRVAKSIDLVPGARGYTPPERSGGVADSHATDVYALGMTLFLLLTGRSMMSYIDREKHDRHVARSLENLPQIGLPAPVLEPLTALIDQMICHDAAARPSWSEVIVRLERLRAHFPDHRDWVGDHVPRVLEILRAEVNHVDVTDFAFLEDDDPSDVQELLMGDAAVRAVSAFLDDAEWDQKQPALQALLARCRPFPVEPFLSVLQRAEKKSWNPWKRPISPAKVETALVLLCDHPSAPVRAQAERLASSSDHRIAVAARFLLTQMD